MASTPPPGPRAAHVQQRRIGWRWRTSLSGKVWGAWHFTWTERAAWRQVHEAIAADRLVHVIAERRG